MGARTSIFDQFGGKSPPKRARTALRGRQEGLGVDVRHQLVGLHQCEDGWWVFYAISTSQAPEIAPKVEFSSPRAARESN